MVSGSLAQKDTSINLVEHMEEAGFFLWVMNDRPCFASFILRAGGYVLVTNEAGGIPQRFTDSVEVRFYSNDSKHQDDGFRLHFPSLDTFLKVRPHIDFAGIIKNKTRLEQKKLDRLARTKGL